MPPIDDSAVREAREYHRRRENRRLAERERLRGEILERVREVVPRLARQVPEIRTVHLFGSILREGRFDGCSDVDVAVVADDPAVEFPFARHLEQELAGRPVDLRVLEGRVAQEVHRRGELVYERADDRARANDRE